MNMQNTDEQVICEIIRKVVKEHSSYDQVAEILSKSRNGVENYFSPNNGSHKLHFFTELNLIQQIDKEAKVVSFLANKAGYRLVPTQGSMASKKDLERLILSVGKENGEVMSAFLEATDPESDNGEHISKEEADLIIKEVNQEIKALEEFKLALVGRSG